MFRKASNIEISADLLPGARNNYLYAVSSSKVASMVFQGCLHSALTVASGMCGAMRSALMLLSPCLHEAFAKLSLVHYVCKGG